ncbi:MAG: hypothetical protein JST82_01915 [Bacteroidetes bacterium]|nr:hypothetical protein [Bacteroidota bacterium]
MKKALLIICCFLPLTVFSQRLFKTPDGVTATDFLNLVEYSQGKYKLLISQRFVKEGDAYYLELRMLNKKGGEPGFLKGGRLHFYMMFHKGEVDVQCTEVKDLNNEGQKYYARYPLTEKDIDMFIQNKFTNFILETAVTTIDAEGDNRVNYDIRSAAAAIITGRDIRGEKIIPETRALPN